MNEITICSHNDELLSEIESMQIEGVSYGRVYFDAANSPETIIAYINIGGAIIGFLAVIIPLVVKRNRKNNTHTELFVRTEEVTVELKEFVAKYKSEVKIILTETPKKK